MIYEAYIPVNDDAGLFRDAFDELAEQVGFVETWSVYRQLDESDLDVDEQELYRFQFEAADTDENRRFLLRWRRTQEQRVRAEIWLIRFRLPQ